MEFEKIVLKSDPRDLERLKKTVGRFSELYPNMIRSKFKYGKLGDDVITYFTVDLDHYRLVFQKLFANDFVILPDTEKASQILKELKRNAELDYNSKPANPSSKTGDQTDQEGTGDIRVDKLVNEGNYEELLRLSKSVGLDRTISTEVQNNIINAVEKAIELNYDNALKRRSAVSSSITNLINIASDQNLKTLQKFDIIKKAGLTAVNICKKFPDFADELITICNNNHLHNLINLTAAVAFWNIVSTDEKLYEIELSHAAKSLNYKWLEIIFDIHRVDMSHDEQESFRALVAYIRTNR